MSAATAPWLAGSASMTNDLGSTGASDVEISRSFFRASAFAVFRVFSARSRSIVTGRLRPPYD
ncbi:hypothetical protein LDL36_20435 [Komagataeibacter sp. FNDCR1]|nr:hypothetical protein [Komagataeibacter sp. FNDCR1]